MDADYSVASGIFNVKLEFGEGEWATYVAETIAQLARASRKGFAFNMLTSHSDEDRKRPDLYYADPCETFEACRTRSPGMSHCCRTTGSGSSPSAFGLPLDPVG